MKTILVHGDPRKDKQRKHLIVDGVLYYLSDPDNDPILRVYVPSYLRTGVITQYHDDNGHMGVQKSFAGIRQKYYWPNLYKEIYQYVTNCVVFKTRYLQEVKQPLRETGIPPYPMAKLSLDFSGPYPTSLSGNKYIIAFVDWFSGWPEAFAVPDKTADTVANLLIEEIYPRYGCPLQIVTDNGTENVNQVIRETLEAMNIHHVLTSVYHPQRNAKVGRFHRTLHDVLAKKLTDNQQHWDLYLNQALADPVYYKNQRMQNLLDARWKPFHRIIAKRGPSSYLIQNQLDGSTIKAHAVDLNPVNLEEWDIPCTKDGRSMRRALYAIPPEKSSEDNDREPDEHLRKVIRRHRREREDSDEEDDIPLMELSKRLKARKEADEEEIREAEEQRQFLEQDQQVQEQEPVDDTMGEDDDPMGEDSFDDAMSVNVVNDCTPTDTEKINCPEKTETLNKLKENK